MKVKNDPIDAQGVNVIVQWLKDNGYSGQEFGQALAAINQARDRGVIADIVFEELFGMSDAEVAGWGIG